MRLWPFSDSANQKKSSLEDLRRIYLESFQGCHWLA